MMHRALKIDRVKDKLAIDIWLRSCSGFLRVNKISSRSLFLSHHLFSLSIPTTFKNPVHNIEPVDS